jgi:peptidoglycan/xylan/chitin deacetylase (PgdA/CDA1 family)
MIGYPPMLVVSPLLKRVVYPALHHSGCLSRITPPRGYAVVNYHGVIPSDYNAREPFLDGNLVQPAVFRQQLQFLKAHYNIIRPEDFRALIEHGEPLPPRAVLLTCDDGLLNTLTDMLPVLQSEGLSCLFFVLAASCGNQPGMLWYDELYQLMRNRSLAGSDLQLPAESGTNQTQTNSSAETFQSRWWSTVRSASRLNAALRAEWMQRVRSHCGPLQAIRSERRWRLLKVCELRQLAQAGMTIGAHTLSHPVLSLCIDDEALSEIQQSKLDLEHALGQPVWAFAYPFGNSATMGERELRSAQTAGFSCAFVNVERWDGEFYNPFALSRIHVNCDMTLPEFAAHLSGLHTRLQRAVGA